MKEINVDTREYIKALIDGKNVVEESLLDAIFDDSQYLTNKFFPLGFVGGASYLRERYISTGRNVAMHRKLHRVPEGRQTMLVHRQEPGDRIPCTLAKNLVRNDGVHYV